jgi:D-serine deaminase-like pyridoxal phosphate-dependent protein
LTTGLSATNTTDTTTRLGTRDYAFYRAAFSGRALPFAYVDLDLLDENARQVGARVRDKRVRIASKSVRSVALLRRLFASDEHFQGVMCFTAREAAYLASQGFDDLLIGYPVVGEQDLATVARATAEGTRVTLMVDCLEHVVRAERTAQEHGVRLPLCLEMDMSMDVPGLHFGVWRSPVRDVAQARPLVERIASSRDVSLDGIMGYEAQIAGLGDRVDGQRTKSTLIRQLKRRSRVQVAERRATLVEMIRSLGVELRFVNGGGTGSILSTRAEMEVTEITVGSAFYSPTLFDSYREFRYLPAAGFAIEIVRRPRSDLYTCLGGGYVASGAARPDKLPRPYLPAGARLLAPEGAGEVQTPVHYSGGEQLGLGDPIFLRHAKAGELCERFTHLLLVAGGAVVDEVTTYRGDGQWFL